jgi:hypothetical protein
MRNRTKRYRLRPVLAEGEILIPPDMVREMRAADRVNQNLEERFRVLTYKLYRAIFDKDWDGAEKLKIKLNAISEILTDV